MNCKALFFLFCGLASLSASTVHAGVIEDSLSAAIKSLHVGRVKMLLHNQPQLTSSMAPNYETFLWQALFSKSSLPLTHNLVFTAEQQQLAELLITAEPELVHLSVLNPPHSPLASLFFTYIQMCNQSQCRAAEGIKARIRFLIEHGAQFDGDRVVENGAIIELPLFLADQHPEVFDFALSLGLSIERSYFLQDVRQTPVERTLLTHLTAHALFDNDIDKSEIAFTKVEALLRRGANPRSLVHISKEDKNVALFSTILNSWDKGLYQAAQDRVKDPQLLRYPRLFRLFFKYGFSANEPFMIPKQDGTWLSTNIIQWGIQHPGWRRKVGRFFSIYYNQVEMGDMDSCEALLATHFMDE